MNQEPIKENNSKQAPAVKPRENQPPNAANENTGLPIIPMTSPKIIPIKNLEPQNPMALFNLAASKSYLSSPGKTLSKSLSKTIIMGFII